MGLSLGHLFIVYKVPEAELGSPALLYGSLLSG